MEAAGRREAEAQLGDFVTTIHPNPEPTMDKTTRTLTDTSKDLTSRIAARILERCPESFANLRASERAELQRAAAGEDGSRIFGLEFKRAGGEAGATLYVNDDRNWDQIEDVTGCYYRVLRVNFQISWASWGSDALAKTATRLRLMCDLQAVAEELEAEFGGRDYYALVSTREEREAAAAKREAALLQQRVSLAVEDECKGLRVGGAHRRFTVDSIPAGQYEVKLGEREYTLVIDGPFATLARLA